MTPSLHDQSRTEQEQVQGNVQRSHSVGQECHPPQLQHNRIKMSGKKPSLLSRMTNPSHVPQMEVSHQLMNWHPTGITEDNSTTNLLSCLMKSLKTTETKTSKIFELLLMLCGSFSTTHSRQGKKKNKPSMSMPRQLEQLGDSGIRQ